MTTKIAQFHDMIQESQKIVFFTGAGASTESHIPDFRSAEGIFMEDMNQKFSPEDVVSHQFLMNHSKTFFDFYFDKLVYPDAEPNSGHQFMADLEAEGKDVTVVTQNIDGLHQKAGSTNVYELHGTTWYNHCLKCGQSYHLSDLTLDEEGIPRCPHDESLVRPDVVLYGEGLDQSTVEKSISAISEADLLVIAGTSLVVYPAAGFVQYYSGDRLVLLNKTDITTPRQVNLSFKQNIGQTLKELSVYHKEKTQS